MLLWFLARDEARSTGWQSGFVSAGGRRKPAFYEFQTLAKAARTQQVNMTRSVRSVKLTDLRALLMGTVRGSQDPPRSWLPVGPLLSGP
jgi:hypothetical protein